MEVPFAIRRIGPGPTLISIYRDPFGVCVCLSPPLLSDPFFNPVAIPGSCPKTELGGKLLRFYSEPLPFLGCVDSVEADDQVFITLSKHI